MNDEKEELVKDKVYEVLNETISRAIVIGANPPESFKKYCEEVNDLILKTRKELDL